MIVTLYTDVRLSPVIYQDAPNWKWKLVENSNDNNFLLRCPIESNNISRCLKLKKETRRKCIPQSLLTQVSDWVPKYIKAPIMENRSSLQIQTTITFYSDVRLNSVIYLDTRNWHLMLLENSNDSNFIHGWSIESRNISRCSKLKTEGHSIFKRQ